MTETLASLTLMKEASKCSETLQEYRLGYENPVGEVSSLDLKQISLDLSFTESQDVPYGSTMSQSTDKYRMMITSRKDLKIMVMPLQTKPNCWNGPRPSG
jgi:hypothetical protein